MNANSRERNYDGINTLTVQKYLIKKIKRIKNMYTVIITITITNVLMYVVKRSNTQKAYGYVVRETD